MSYTLNQLKALELEAQAKKAFHAIADKIRGSAMNSLFDVIYVAYLFYKLSSSECSAAQELSYPSEEAAKMQLSRFESGEITLNPYIRSSVLTPRIKQCFIEAYKVYEIFNNDDRIYASLVALFDDYFRMSMGKFSDDTSTPDSIVKLAQAILNVEDRDRVADICCGNGNFLIKCYEIAPRADYFGYEININNATILAMRADVLDVNPSIVVDDVGYALSDKSIEFDKIFSDPPLGMLIDKYNQAVCATPFRLSRNSSDWYFNNIVIEHLSKNGKAVTVAGMGSAWNTASQNARKYFIDNGYIEAVINLPGGLLPSTNIPLVLYVFSHNNKTVRFVNAEGLAIIEDRRSKTFSDDNIREIIELLQNDSEKNITVTVEDIKSKDYSLAFRSYRSGLPKYENGTPISEVAEIIRGTLDPRTNTTTENTGKYLLQIADLENGLIKADLGDDRYIIAGKEHSGQKLLPYDIVVSRSAQPAKVAIIPPDETRELYSNGNMFIIRAKNSNVNPYYLAAFLLSKDGRDALDYASTGSALKTISANSLYKLIFPLKEASEQKKIAEALLESMIQYKAYLHKADLAKSSIENAYYFSSEEDSPCRN